MFEQIAKGFLLPYQGLKFIFSHKKLLTFVGLPIVINFFVYGLIIWLFVRFATGSLTFLSMDIWYERLLYYAVIGIGVVLLLFLMLFIFVALANILGSFFYEFLSRKTAKILKIEEKETSTKSAETVKLMWESFGGGIKRILIFIIAQLALLIISLLPLIGAIIITVMNIMVTGWFLAMEFLDFEFDRREWSFDKKMKVWEKNKWSMLGFGLGVLTGSVVPIFNIIFLPGCVVAASLYYKEFLHKK